MISVQTLHVVGRKHAGLPGALDRAEHPSLIDGLRVNDHVTVTEGDLVVILSGVIIQRPVHPLLDTTTHTLHTHYTHYSVSLTQKHHLHPMCSK